MVALPHALAPGVRLYVGEEGVVFCRPGKHDVCSGSVASEIALCLAEGRAPTPSLDPRVLYARAVALQQWEEEGWITAQPSPLPEVIAPLEPTGAWQQVDFSKDAAPRLQALVPARAAGTSVLFAADYLSVSLERAVAEALARGRVLLVRPCGYQAWVGPLLGKDEGTLGAWQGALRRNRRLENWLAAQGYQTHASPCWPWPDKADQHRLRDQIEQALGDEPGEDSCLITLEKNSEQAHRLPSTRRVPAMTRAEMVPYLRRLVSPLTGIVEEVRNVATPDEEPFFVGHHALDHHPQTLRQAFSGNRTPCFGKGVTPLLAEGSAIAEGVERYSGVYTGEEQVRIASYRDMSACALDPAALQLFSEHQYRRLQDATDDERYAFVPEPLDPDVPFAWVEVQSLAGQADAFVPAAWAYYGVRDPGARFFDCNSNGTAAGTSRDDALAHALCELIERDAVAVWWYNRLGYPGIAPAAFHHPYLAALRARLDATHRDVWALDLTHDLGVPVVAVLSARRTLPERVVMGFGCALDLGDALLRAATELVQSMPREAQHDGPGDPAPEGGEWATRWMACASRATMPYLVPDAIRGTTSVGFGNPAPTRDTPASVLGSLVDALRARGLTPYLLDQTRPETGIPVVRAVVPGMRHFWRRLAPGRLYDVPVEMGWRVQALAEHDLNPYPLFL